MVGCVNVVFSSGVAQGQSQQPESLHLHREGYDLTKVNAHTHRGSSTCFIKSVCVSTRYKHTYST